MRQVLACGCVAAAALAVGLSFTKLGVVLEERLGLPALYAARGVERPPEGAVIVAVDSTSRDWLAELPADTRAWPNALRQCIDGPSTARAIRQSANAPVLPRETYACALDRTIELGADVAVLHVAFNTPAAGDARLRASLERHAGKVALLQYVERGVAEPRLIPLAPALRDAATSAPFLLPSLGRAVHQYWRELAWLSNRDGPIATLPDVALDLAGHPAHAPARGTSTYFKHYGPAGTLTTLPLVALFADSLIGVDGQAVELDFTQTAIFIGEADPHSVNQRDRFVTVFDASPGVPGVELAATAYINLLHGEALQRLSYGVSGLLTGLVTLAGFAIALRADIRFSLIGIALLAVAYGAATYALFTYQAIWLPLAIPVFFMLPLAALVSLLRHYMLVHSWLSALAPRRLVDLLVSGQQRPRYLGPRQVAVMFTDLAGYSAFAERHDPAEIEQFLNGHFRDAVACIEGQGGVVASFTGDGVFAFWGAPEPIPDAAERAARAALALAERFAADYAERQARGLEVIRLRVGLHYGTGNAALVGGGARRNYTVVGDVVNSTQRIEQLGKAFLGDDEPVIVLASTALCRELPDGSRIEPLGAHRVHGHHEPLTVARLWSLSERTRGATGRWHLKAASW